MMQKISLIHSTTHSRESTLTHMARAKKTVMHITSQAFFCTNTALKMKYGHFFFIQ